MNNCIFCKIANGKIPTNMVYQDSVVAAFLDNSQVTKGHTLLVPRKHLKDITEYSVEDAGAVFKRIPIIVDAMKKAFPDMKGLNILNNNGEIAGQSVFHSHIHIIPRYGEDDNFTFGKKYQREGEVSDEELKATAKQISDQIEVDA